MSVKEDRDNLHKAIIQLKNGFDGIDLTEISDSKEIMQHLDNIDDVFIQVQQFKSRWTVEDWLSWGHDLWAYIERNKQALERDLARIERANSQKLHKFDRWITLISLFFVAIATLSAAVSAYYAYLSFGTGKDQPETIQKVKPEKSPNREEGMPLNKQPNKDI